MGLKPTWIVAVIISLLSVTAAEAQQPQLQSFRVEWERRTSSAMKPGIEGYVYNDSAYRVSNVRLRVEELDTSGRVLGERSVYVYGGIDAGGRGYFLLPVSGTVQTYRLTIESFDVISRQAP